MAIWWGIFNLLFLLQPLVVPPARSEGKGGLIVELTWLLCAGPVCIVMGAAWPHTVGRRLRRPGSKEGSDS